MTRVSHIVFQVQTTTGQVAITYGVKKTNMISINENLAGAKRPAKKEKLKPVILTTREGMEAAVNDYARLKLDHLAEVARMESEKTAVEKRYEARINDLARQIEDKFASVQNYCLTHRAELLPDDKKSFETVAATVKFYNTPHRVEVRRKENLGTLAKRLLGLVFNVGKADELNCDKYVRESDPALNKEALLADRSALTDEQLLAMNIKFEWDEIFTIEPKSELVTGDKTNAEVPV